MSTLAKSRWANEQDDLETEAVLEQRRREKEAKKRAKAERQRKLEEDAAGARNARGAAAGQSLKNGGVHVVEVGNEPPKKRRRLSNEDASASASASAAVAEEQVLPPSPQDAPKRSTLLRFPAPEWGSCRHVDNFERLNHIEEGSYGWVSRAKDNTTGEIVALKKLKMENSPDGFPVTGLREIQTLLEARHTNIVHLREVVMGERMDE